MEGCKAWLIEDPAGQSGEVAVGEFVGTREAVPL
ncbi:hypothetical protein LMG9964_03245 [Paraburkholderia phenoliruptrix]|uniref:Uncharacterized protein n=1 Tax=Paraburkholderia phenoliruptrix TaxID=252970 RepID=A0A6J5K9D9_9BURK|nr:hypothetical protein LMG9964_03245 [Paraburkholderia phenoliruptrix]